MKVDIYKSDTHGSKYLFRETELYATGINVRDPDFKNPIKIKSGVELHTLNINNDEVEKNINTIGYYIVTLGVNPTESPN